MLKVFPKDLAEPIDASYLRMVVRKVRQRAQKKRKAGGGGGGGSGGNTNKSAEAGGAAAAKKRKLEAKLAELDDNAPPPTLEVRVPGRGVSFPTFHYNAKDFERGHL